MLQGDGRMMYLAARRNEGDAVRYFWGAWRNRTKSCCLVGEMRKITTETVPDNLGQLILTPKG